MLLLCPRDCFNPTFIELLKLGAIVFMLAWKYPESNGNFSEEYFSCTSRIFSRTSVFSMDAYILTSTGKQQHFVMVPVGIIFMRTLYLEILAQNGKSPNVMSF